MLSVGKKIAAEIEPDAQWGVILYSRHLTHSLIFLLVSNYWAMGTACSPCICTDAAASMQ